MAKLNAYVADVLEKVEKKYHWEKEFVQAVHEVMGSLTPLFDQEPSYQKHKILERVIEPERVYMFRVPWRDAEGNIQVNMGYRIGFNSALGPYKGGIRFHESVNLGILKFLSFEQIFKNALTGLALGGGKGGSDFSPRGRTEAEIENFCQSYMTGLYKHIGQNTDVPAGDIGVGGREIGWLFGQYKRLINAFEPGVITGKSPEWGGSLMRPESTGFGIVYFAAEMLKTIGQSIEGKTVCVSGFGNVSWGAVQKASQLGGKVVTLSGPDGFIYDPNGISGEKIDYMRVMRNSGRDMVKDYADKYKVEFYPGKRPWGVKCDLALPCARENEMDEADAKELVKNGCTCLTEGANMPLTAKAAEVIMATKMLYSPGKASNAGGVSCSGLEMVQNSCRTPWTAEEVDQKLRNIMTAIHQRCVDAAAQYGTPGNYINGANIAGFKRVAQAMIDQGNI